MKSVISVEVNGKHGLFSEILSSIIRVQDKTYVHFIANTLVFILGT